MKRFKTTTIIMLIIINPLEASVAQENNKEASALESKLPRKPIKQN